MIEIVPQMLEDHGMSVDGAEESSNILAQSFCSSMFPSQFVITAFDAWYCCTGDTFSDRHVADNMKLIGAREAVGTGLVQNRTDTVSLRQVLDVFPDAEDGKFRAVISARDPGLPNWLDGMRHRKGTLVGRWHACSSAPLLTLIRVTLEEVRGHLRVSTPSISTDERRAALLARTRGAQLRRSW